MFYMVYVFKVKSGMEKEFERTWQLVTKAFYETAGSLETAVFTEMNACLDSVEVPYQLGVVADLLRDNVLSRT